MWSHSWLLQKEEESKKRENPAIGQQWREILGLERSARPNWSKGTEGSRDRVSKGKKWN